MNLTSLLADIDAATSPVCAQCDGPLNDSPSDDFCSDDCQRAWLRIRADATAVRESMRPDPYPYTCGNVDCWCCDQPDPILGQGTGRPTGITQGASLTFTITDEASRPLYDLLRYGNVYDGRGRRIDPQTAYFEWSADSPDRGVPYTLTADASRRWAAAMEQASQRITEDLSRAFNAEIAGLAPPSPPSPETVLSSCLELAGTFSTPQPTTIECGDIALEAVRRSARSARPADAGRISSLLGIPVRLDDTLDPDEIRVLDQDGNVLRSWRVDGGPPPPQDSTLVEWLPSVDRSGRVRQGWRVRR